MFLAHCLLGLSPLVHTKAERLVKVGHIGVCVFLTSGVRPQLYYPTLLGTSRKATMYIPPTVIIAEYHVTSTISVSPLKVSSYYQEDTVFIIDDIYKGMACVGPGGFQPSGISDIAGLFYCIYKLHVYYQELGQPFQFPYLRCSWLQFGIVTQYSMSELAKSISCNLPPCNFQVFN